MTDRADLARQRQLMRVKQGNSDKNKTNATKKKKASEEAIDAAPSRAERSRCESQEKSATTVKVVKRASTTQKATRMSALGSSNMALLVRQVLQRKHYGDVAEYLTNTKKDELFQLMTQMAQYAYELREKLQSNASSAQQEGERMQQRTHELTGRLITVEAQLAANECQRCELEGRLVIAQEEYTAIVDSLRKYEDKWSETQTTIAQQRQLLDELSRSLDERTGQVDALAGELETMKAAHVALQDSQVLQLESERMQQHLADERRENKALLWEFQNKTRDYEDATNQLGDAKDRILTLEGQIQVQLIGRQSIVQERDAIQLLHRREREDWKAAQEARGEADHLKAQDFRSMDLEIRQLKQTLNRLRADFECERTQREKAESTALRATDIADELKAAGKQLQFDVQRLFTELQEERAVRESKEGALTVAYRDLQSLQKRMREEESARTDAQAEVEALMHRMKLIRRDHLSMLHRVEVPPQVISRWKESAGRQAD